MDDLRAVRIFLTVAELAGFAATARRLSMTPASVTRAVAGLEKALGTQLLLRTTRHVSLTPAGAVYAARMAPLIAEIDRAGADLQAGDGAISGRVRLTAPMSFGLEVLPDLVADFRAAHPRVDLQIVLSDEFLDIVGAGYDVAVRITVPPVDKSTIWRKICPIDRTLVASAGSRARDVADPADLPANLLVAHDATGWFEQWLLTHPSGERRVLKAGKTLSVNSGDLIARLLAREDGVALLPWFLVKDHITAGTLVPILPDWQTPQLWLSLSYPPYELLPPPVATFSEFFEEHVTETRPLRDVLGQP
ncbi:MAG: LysR family transcriptional regulator [Pseudomonadota bacterium]